MGMPAANRERATPPPNRQQRRHPPPTKDVEGLRWVADQLNLSLNTVYALARSGSIPGAHKWGAQWRVSVAAFLKAVHGDEGAA